MVLQTELARANSRPGTFGDRRSARAAHRTRSIGTSYRCARHGAPCALNYAHSIRIPRSVLESTLSHARACKPSAGHGANRTAEATSDPVVESAPDREQKIEPQGDIAAKTRRR